MAADLPRTDSPRRRTSDPPSPRPGGNDGIPDNVPGHWWVSTSGIGRGWQLGKTIQFVARDANDGYERGNGVVIEMPDGSRASYKISGNRASSNLVPANKDTDRPYGADIRQCLEHINDPSIGHEIATRLLQQRTPFTRVAENVMLFLNPLGSLGDTTVLSDVTLKRWQKPGCDPNAPGQEPHLWQLARLAIDALIRQKKSQTIVLSGVSGSGKTEMERLLMRFFCTRTNAATQLRTPVAAPGPPAVAMAAVHLLSALGNAATVHNESASRFNKCTFLTFTKDEEHLAPISVEFSVFQLETSRVCHTPTNERNYHILYQLLATGNDTAARLGLDPTPSGHFYLARSGRYKLSSIDDAEERKKTDAALKECGFTVAQTTAFWSTLASVILLGDVHFTWKENPTGGETCVDAASKNIVNRAAWLLGVVPNELTQTLVARTQHSGHGRHTYTASQSEQARDSFVTMIYERLFYWVIAKINTMCRADASHVRRMSPHRLGVLDISGFEQFDTIRGNTFDQLLINYTNERLQGLYNDCLFRRERMLYESERVDWPLGNLRTPDNTSIITALDSAALSSGADTVFSILNDETLITSSTDDKLLHRLTESKLVTIDKQARRTAPDTFVIQHYAGRVVYTATGMLAYNRNYTFPWHQQFLATSSCNSIIEISNTTVGGMATSVQQSPLSPRMGRRALLIPTAVPNYLTTNRPRNRSLIGGTALVSPRPSNNVVNMDEPLSDGVRPVGVAHLLSHTLSALIAQMNESGLFFVRCLRSNATGERRRVDGQLVVDQLRMSGISQALTLYKHGLPVRIYGYEFDDIFLSGEPDGVTKENILEKFRRQEWKIGSTRVFLSYRLHNYLIGIAGRRRHWAQIRIARAWRNARVSRLATPTGTLSQSPRHTDTPSLPSPCQAKTPPDRVLSPHPATAQASERDDGALRSQGDCSQCTIMSKDIERQRKRLADQDTYNSENEALLVQINEENVSLQRQVEVCKEVINDHRGRQQLLEEEVSRIGQVMDRIYAVENTILQKCDGDYALLVAKAIEKDEEYVIYEPQDTGGGGGGGGDNIVLADGQDPAPCDMAREEYYPSAGVLISRYILFINDASALQLVEELQTILYDRTYGPTLRRQCYIAETVIMVNAVLRQEVRCSTVNRKPFYVQLCDATKNMISHALNTMCRWLADQCAEDARTSLSRSAADAEILKIDNALLRKFKRFYSDMTYYRVPAWIIAQVFMQLVYIVDTVLFNSILRSSVPQYGIMSGCWIQMNIIPLRAWLMNTSMRPLVDTIDFDQGRLFFRCADLARLWQHGKKDALVAHDIHMEVCPNLTRPQMAQALRIYRSETGEPRVDELLVRRVQTQSSENVVGHGKFSLALPSRESGCGYDTNEDAICIGNMDIFHVVSPSIFSLQFAYRVDLRIFSAMAAQQKWIDWFEIDMSGGDAALSDDAVAQETSAAVEYFTRTDSRRQMQPPEYVRPAQGI